MAEIAGVQEGATHALETAHISLRYRGYKTQISRIQYAPRGIRSPKTVTAPQHQPTTRAYGQPAGLADTTSFSPQKPLKFNQKLKQPSLPLSAALQSSTTADFQYI